MSVLFAPLGNTDPIMNYHDGPACTLLGTIQTSHMFISFDEMDISETQKL